MIFHFLFILILLVSVDGWNHWFGAPAVDGWNQEISCVAMPLMRCLRQAMLQHRSRVFCWAPLAPLLSDSHEIAIWVCPRIGDTAAEQHPSYSCWDFLGISSGLRFAPYWWVSKPIIYQYINIIHISMSMSMFPVKNTMGTLWGNCWFTRGYPILRPCRRVPIGHRQHQRHPSLCSQLWRHWWRHLSTWNGYNWNQVDIYYIYVHIIIYICMYNIYIHIHMIIVYFIWFLCLYCILYIYVCVYYI